jgi:homoaconitate hydratase
VTGKDVIITLCGYFNQDEVLNHAIEFAGAGIDVLNIDQRLTIANMTTEWGALTGVFPVDRITLDWLHQRSDFIRQRGLAGVPSDADGNGQHPRLTKERIQELEKDLLSADEGAGYAKELHLDLGSVQPHISGPNSVKVMTPIAEATERRIKINKAYLVSCVNSRVDDITEAAEILRGKKIAEHVDFYVAAASSEVQSESEKAGDWQALIGAGAKPLPPGCGPCIGLGTGLLEDGEVGISATNRNFKGRMGSREADAYLASPAVVAASALAGYITYPGNWSTSPAIGSLQISSGEKREKKTVDLLEDFPETITGAIVFCHQDNLNTDGIYPGKYTYIDEFTAEQQAEVVMENYDPEFKNIVQTGDILIGGFNFGTGSSREQAATALKHKGVQLVIAGSFSETYKRNAINNGFLTIEAPDLVKNLKNELGTTNLSVRPGTEIQIDFTRSQLVYDTIAYEIGPVGIAAQELILSGGLENWVRNKISN